MKGNSLFGMPALVLAASTALAGPPFQTDDPEPIDFSNYEFYTFASSDGTPLETDTQGPALEFNWGAASQRSPSHHRSRRGDFSRRCSRALSASGTSSLESNTDFVQETKHRPHDRHIHDVRNSDRQRAPRPGRRQDLVQGAAVGAEKLWPLDHVRRRRRDGVQRSGLSQLSRSRAGWCRGTSARSGLWERRFSITARKVRWRRKHGLPR